MRLFFHEISARGNLPDVYFVTLENRIIFEAQLFDKSVCSKLNHLRFVHLLQSFVC